MYYAVISAAVIMFSFQFLFNQIYEKTNGGSLRSMLIFTLGANFTGLFILLCINKFKLEFSWFTTAIALLAAINNLLYSYCSLKALGKINLSLYSVFAMLGGMTLPFIVGIFAYNEEITLGKVICFTAITASLFLTIEKGTTKNGLLYYSGVFIMNGMSGVLSKIYQSTDIKKTGEAGYSMMISFLIIIICLLMLIFIKKPDIRFSYKALGASAGYGLLSNTANFLLLLSLSHIPASAQYPFITGGVMIVSTIICFFTQNKPSKKEIVSVLLSFAGILALLI